MKPNIKIALLQIRGNASEPKSFRQVQEHIGTAAKSGAQIVVLPELFLHPYFCQTQDPKHFELAHSVEDPRVETLQDLAALYKVVLVLPFFEKQSTGIHYNSAAVMDADGSLLGLYRKNHIPQDPGFEEKYYFTPGDLGFPIFETQYGKIGVLICFDQWFPEAARLTAAKGCDILIYPTAIGWDHREWKGLDSSAIDILKQEQLEAWQTIQRSHAIANGVFVASVNRIGVEGHLEFWGHSFVCNPMGRYIHSYEIDSFQEKKDSEKETTEQIVFADCALQEIDDTRKVWTFWRDRRVDLY